jgi:hypothetical protein
MKRITIEKKSLPTNEICISSKRRWTTPSCYEPDYQTAVTLTEEEVYENAARAVREVEQAEEELRLAQRRAESLRLFVSELAKSEQLSVVNG